MAGYLRLIDFGGSFGGTNPSSTLGVNVALYEGALTTGYTTPPSLFIQTGNGYRNIHATSTQPAAYVLTPGMTYTLYTQILVGFSSDGYDTEGSSLEVPSSWGGLDTAFDYAPLPEPAPLAAFGCGGALLLLRRASRPKPGA